MVYLREKEYYQKLKEYCSNLTINRFKNIGQKLISKIYPLLRNYDLEIIGEENIALYGYAYTIYNLFLALLTQFERKLNEKWENGVKISLHKFYSQVDVVKVQFLKVETKNLSKIKPIFNSVLKDFIVQIENLQENDVNQLKNQGNFG